MAKRRRIVGPILAIVVLVLFIILGFSFHSLIAQLVDLLLVRVGVIDPIMQTLVTIGVVMILLFAIGFSIRKTMGRMMRRI